MPNYSCNALIFYFLPFFLGTLPGRSRSRSERTVQTAFDSAQIFCHVDSPPRPSLQATTIGYYPGPGSRVDRRPPPVRDHPVQLQPTTHSQGYPHATRAINHRPNSTRRFLAPQNIAQQVTPLPRHPALLPRRQSSAVHAGRLVSDCY